MATRFKSDRQRKAVMSKVGKDRTAVSRLKEAKPDTGRWSVIMDDEVHVFDSLQEAKDSLADFSDTGFVSMGKRKKDGSYTVKVPSEYGEGGTATLILEPYED